jgi:hypothetical protein
VVGATGISNGSICLVNETLPLENEKFPPQASKIPTFSTSKPVNFPVTNVKFLLYRLIRAVKVSFSAIMQSYDRYIRHSNEAICLVNETLLFKNVKFLSLVSEITTLIIQNRLLLHLISSMVFRWSFARDKGEYQH